MEKEFDVLILGGGRNGETLAQKIHSKDCRVGMVNLPQRPESYLESHISTLHGKTPPDIPTLSECEVLKGDFNFISKNRVEINGDSITAEKFILNCGVQPAIPPAPGFEKAFFFLPQQILLQEAQPKSAIILGGGPSGIITAQKLVAAGCHIQLVCNSEQLLPHWDAHISGQIEQILRRENVEIFFDAKIEETLQESNQQHTVTFTSPQGPNRITADTLIVATGFKSNTQNKNLKQAGVYVDSNESVVINDEMQTSAPHIWALGGVTNSRHSLALERTQVEFIANNISSPFFSKHRLEPEPIPLSIPFSPGLAQLGLTESQAKEKYSDIKTVIIEWENTVIKLVGRENRQTILGVHVLGGAAAEITLYFDLVMRAQIPLDNLNDPHHYPHLTSCEAVQLAIEKWVSP